MTCSLRTLTFAGGVALAVFAAALAPGAASIFAQTASRPDFDRWDRDGNQQLSIEELPENARGNFQRVDQNSDGFISREEHERFVGRSRTSAKTPAATAENSQPLPDAPRVPDGIRAERDIAYADSDHVRQQLDLYLPVQPQSDRLPLVVFIHGGGWKNGDKSGGARQVFPYVTTGEFAGASIGYRLSGDATWPVQIHDCKAAIRWLRANADRYGIDPDRIGVMGSSAGGHLVAMLGVSGDVPALEGDLGSFDDADSRVTCVVDLYGPSDLLSMSKFPSQIDHDSPESPESKLIGGAIQEHADRTREASPLTHVSADDAPFLIIHGTDDPAVPYNQSEQLDAALRAAGVPSQLVRVEGGGHGGFGNPEVEARTRLFFERHLLGREVTIPTDPVAAAPRQR